MIAAAPAARPVSPTPSAIAAVSAVAAAGLACSSTGSMVVAAGLLGVATLDRRSGLAAVLAAAAVAVRFATTDLGDLAGIQSVLGPAGEVGPPAAAASAWAAAAALVLASAPRSIDPSHPPAGSPGSATVWVPGGLLAFLVAVAGGSLAAAVAVGPGPGGELVLRVAATAAASVLAFGIGRATGGPRRDAVRAWLAVAAGLASVVLAGWPS